MPDPIVHFSNAEIELLRELEIAVFRNKIITDAQPPITDSQRNELEQLIQGSVPPELMDLWNTAFGGAVDYDYEVMFGDHLFSASFRELYYPNSQHYHDLYGWIDHELELAQDAAKENSMPLPKQSDFLPFGGFEYLERFYTSQRPEDYGSVLVYAQGIPWKGSLNQNSVATVASSVAELFDQLCLNEDPFDEDSDEYGGGQEMARADSGDRRRSPGSRDEAEATRSRQCVRLAIDRAIC